MELLRQFYERKKSENKAKIARAEGAVFEEFMRFTWVIDDDIARQ